MRMAREFYIPFLSSLLVFSGRYLTMAHGSVLSVHLFGRGWWEEVRSIGGRHEHPGQMCEGCPHPEIPLALSCPQQCRLGTIILKYGVEKKYINKVSYPQYCFPLSISLSCGPP